jgi:hypothetical protein
MAMQMKLSRTDLCALSHRVVVGEVTDIETRWTEGVEGGIERVVRVAVSDAVKGGDTAAVDLLLPGGQIGEVGHWVEDVPQLMVNGQYLLFLAPGLTDARLQVIGGEFGAVRITPQGARVGETLGRALKTVEVCRASN